MKRAYVIHPFLFALFPILFLFAHNISFITVSEVLRPVLISICFTFLLWLLLGVIIKNMKKAGLIVSCFLLLFFSYGHVFNLIRDLGLMDIIIGVPQLLLFFWGIIFIFCLRFIIKTSRNLFNLTNYLNIIAASLIIISLLNIGIYKLKVKLSPKYENSVQSQKIDIEAIKRLPDIYYIILDGYGREDILKDMYNYDNKEFLEYLTQEGFYIANKSRSNYSQTYLSLASSLHMKYLNELVKKIGTESQNREPLFQMIRNNYVIKFLKQYDYKIVVFSDWFRIRDFVRADIQVKRVDRVREFEVLIIRTSILAVILMEVPKLYNRLFRLDYDLHRKRILYPLDHLADITDIEDPVFVFAHIYCPHPPFIFGENGEEIQPNRLFATSDGTDFIKAGGTREEYLEKYPKQLAFINKRIKATINAILAKSDSPPVIVLQSDHGPGSMYDVRSIENSNINERMFILNAYYLPGGGYKWLYDEITPVNTFRIIFNHYFGTDYKLLKDESYFSTWYRPYKFLKVTIK